MAEDQLIVGGIATAVVTAEGLARRMVDDVAACRAEPDARPPKLVFSSNGQGVALYARDAGFRGLLDRADIVHADGMSVVFASRLFGRPGLPERIATTDFFHDAARAAGAAADPPRFYLLGAKPAQVDAAVARARALYPGVPIVGWRDGYFSKAEEAEVCADIRASGADVLWLGLGRPKQEEFAVRNRHRLSGVAWIKTCGGLFDFLSGERTRAPDWMQTAGLEWFYRMSLEPRRLGWRYLTTNIAATWLLASRTRKDGRTLGGPADAAPHA